MNWDSLCGSLASAFSTSVELATRSAYAIPIDGAEIKNLQQRLDRIITALGDAAPTPAVTMVSEDDRPVTFATEPQGRR